MDEQLQQIYNDKIKLAQTIIEREFEMITRFRKLHKHITVNSTPESERCDLDLFHSTWEIIMQLYDFAEDSYLSKLKKKDNKRYDKLVAVVDKYNTFNKTNWDDYVFAYNTIKYVICINGFHDVTRIEEDDDFKDY